MDKDFWKKKQLSDFSEEEWEAICMQCGICCLTKYGENNKIVFTNEMCDGFDFKRGRCSRYNDRLCNDCLKVDMHLLQTSRELLPETCPYRLLYEGKELPQYHPLVSGNSNSVHKAKQTVLEMPEIFSKKECQATLANREKLTLEQFSKKMVKYQIFAMRIYDIPTK